MWHQSFSVETKEVSRQQIWQVLTDIEKWKEWDKDIEFTKLNGKLGLHTDFILKPKAGPKTKLTITQLDEPHVFADISHLPLAKMLTIHTLTETPNGVKIQVDIKIMGLLTFLWSKVIGQKQIDGGVIQTQQLIAKAKEYETNRQNISI